MVLYFCPEKGVENLKCDSASLSSTQSGMEKFLWKLWKSMEVDFPNFHIEKTSHGAGLRNFMEVMEVKRYKSPRANSNFIRQGEDRLAKG